VSGRIDLNVFNGTESQWRAWRGGRSIMADAQ
jgi:lysozyme